MPTAEGGTRLRGRDGSGRRFADRYARFRGSRLFLWLLTAFLAFWFGCNLLPFLPHFDRPGYGVLNVILSAEASLSVALLMAAAERQDEVQRRQLEYLLHLIEAIHGQMVGQGARESDRSAHRNLDCDAEKVEWRTS